MKEWIDFAIIFLTTGISLVLYSIIFRKHNFLMSLKKCFLTKASFKPAIILIVFNDIASNLMIWIFYYFEIYDFYLHIFQGILISLLLILLPKLSLKF